MTGRLDPADRESVEHFIIENTELLSPPLVPEIVLYLAAESLPIWQKTEEELGEMNLPPPYWAFAWAGGQALARYLIDHPDTCSNRDVLDIGSGSGIAAIAAAKAGARSVEAADVDGIATVACALNAEANGVQLALSGADPLSKPPPRDSILIVGDLFYERELAGRAMRYITAAKALGTDVYVGDPRRNYFPEDRFTRLAEYSVPVTRELEDAEIKRSAVWQA